MIELQASTTAIIQQREGVEVELKAVINGIDYQLMSIDSIGAEASIAVDMVSRVPRLTGTMAKIVATFRHGQETSSETLIEGRVESPSWSEGTRDVSMVIDSVPQLGAIGWNLPKTNAIDVEMWDNPTPTVFGTMLRVPAVLAYGGARSKLIKQYDRNTTEIHIDGFDRLPPGPVELNIGGIRSRGTFNANNTIFTVSEHNLPFKEGVSVTFLADGLHVTSSENLVGYYLTDGIETLYCYTKDATGYIVSSIIEGIAGARTVSLSRSVCVGWPEVINIQFIIFQNEYGIYRPNGFLIGEGARITLYDPNNGNNVVHVISADPVETVYEVMAYRKTKNGSSFLAPVPSGYYVKNLDTTFADRQCATITFKQMLTAREGEGWENDTIYVSMKSTLPDTIEAAVTLLAGTVPIDGTFVENGPLAAVIDGKTDRVEIVQMLLEQSMHSFDVRNGIMYVNYLGIIPDEPVVLDVHNTDMQSVVLGELELVDVATSITGEWYRDRDSKTRSVILRESDPKYTSVDERIECLINNVQLYAEQKLKWLANRRLKPWTTFQCTLPRTMLGLQVGDVVKLDWGMLPNGTYGQITSIGYGPLTGEIAVSGTCNVTDQVDNTFFEPLVVPPQPGAADGLSEIDYFIQPELDNGTGNTKENRLAIDIPSTIKRGDTFIANIYMVDGNNRRIKPIPTALRGTYTLTVDYSQDVGDSLNRSSFNLPASGATNLNLVFSGGVGETQVTLKASRNGITYLSNVAKLGAIGETRDTIPFGIKRDTSTAFSFTGLQPSTTYQVSFVSEDSAEVLDPVTSTVNSDASGNATFTAKAKSGTKELNGYFIRLEDTVTGHVYVTNQKCVYNIAGGFQIITVSGGNVIGTVNGVTYSGIKRVTTDITTLPNNIDPNNGSTTTTNSPSNLPDGIGYGWFYDAANVKVKCFVLIDRASPYYGSIAAQRSGAAQALTYMTNNLGTFPVFRLGV